MMPKLDGYAVCAELRRLENPVPVLMLTAKGQVEDRVTGSETPARMIYLVKPFSTEEIASRASGVAGGGGLAARLGHAAREVEAGRGGKLIWPANGGAGRKQIFI